jgi:hypothetical protein
VIILINYSDINVKIDDPELNKLTKKGANIIINYNGKKLKVPKILNGHRKDNQKTKAELKKLKLMPDAPPVGYGLQQFNGEIFFIYDMDKTKKYSSSEEEKEQQRIYRKDLKERKRCNLCGKVQKTLNYLSHIYINNRQSALANEFESEPLELQFDIQHIFDTRNLATLEEKKDTMASLYNREVRTGL